MSPVLCYSLLENSVLPTPWSIFTILYVYTWKLGTENHKWNKTFWGGQGDYREAICGFILTVSYPLICSVNMTVSKSNKWTNSKEYVLPKSLLMSCLIPPHWWQQVTWPPSTLYSCKQRNQGWRGGSAGKVIALQLWGPQHLYKQKAGRMTEGTCNPSTEDAEMGGSPGFTG